MRPGEIHLQRADGATAFVKDRIGHIRKDVDQTFRKMLREAVAQDGGQTARWYIIRALDQGPSRGGAMEAMRHFGDGLNVKLALTAEIIDGLEIAKPGFKKWLELTGFANDVTMIKGFVAWAEANNGRGRVLPGMGN